MTTEDKAREIADWLELNAMVHDLDGGPSGLNPKKAEPYLLAALRATRNEGYNEALEQAATRAFRGGEYIAKAIRSLKQDQASDSPATTG